MNDSADINGDMKKAMTQLDNALSELESVMMPIASNFSRLKQQVDETSDLDKDRAALAQQLDDSKTREAELERRQQELTQMADAAMTDLDGVIAEVKSALGQA